MNIGKWVLWILVFAAVIGGGYYAYTKFWKKPEEGKPGADGNKSDEQKKELESSEKKPNSVPASAPGSNPSGLDGESIALSKLLGYTPAIRIDGTKKIIPSDKGTTESKALQRFLNKNFKTNLVEDGVIGTKTKNALSKHLQAGPGLTLNDYIKKGGLAASTGLLGMMNGVKGFAKPSSPPGTGINPDFSMTGFDGDILTTR